MSSYFYVVNQSSGKVLDSHRNYHNAQLIAHEENGSSGQLWKWDSEARLVNKHGFVAEILEGSKDTGTPIILNTPDEKCLGQKWMVEEDTIKSGLSGLVMDASKSWVIMKEASSSLYQKWEFVPEERWEDYKKMLGDRNPLSEAAFWKDVVENFTHVIIGFNIEEYGSEVKQAIEVMNMYADKLEKVNKGTGVTQATGGLASVIGGGMAIGGLLLAPFTAGASLALTIGGTAVGIGGGAVTLTSSVVNSGYGQSKSKKVKNATGPVFNATMRLENFLNHCIKKLNQANEFLKTKKGEAIAMEVYSDLEKIKHGGNAVYKTYKLGDVIAQGVKTAKKLKQMKSVVNFVRADYYTAKLGMAASAAAPGVTIPKVGSLFAGKTIVAAGSVGAKALSGSLAGIGIAFGLWDLTEAYKTLKDGSLLAKELRKTATELETESEKLITILRDLLK